MCYLFGNIGRYLSSCHAFWDAWYKVNWVFSVVYGRPFQMLAVEFTSRISVTLQSHLFESSLSSPSTVNVNIHYLPLQLLLYSTTTARDDNHQPEPQRWTAEGFTAFSCIVCTVRFRAFKILNQLSSYMIPSKTVICNRLCRDFTQSLKSL